MNADKVKQICDIMGKDKGEDFLAKFGFGPRYVPKEAKKHSCPSCGEKIAVYKEIHPDTDMNEIVLECPNCGQQEGTDTDLKCGKCGEKNAYLKEILPRDGSPKKKVIVCPDCGAEVPVS